MADMGQVSLLRDLSGNMRSSAPVRLQKVMTRKRLYEHSVLLVICTLAILRHVECKKKGTTQHTQTTPLTTPTTVL